MSPIGATTALLIGLGIGLLARLVIPSRLRAPGVADARRGRHRQRWSAPLLAQAIGVASTPGIDWSEIVLPSLTGATGVAAAAGAYGRQSTAR